MTNQELISRYLNAEASKEEIELLKTYLKGKDLSQLEEFMDQDWSAAEWETEELPADLSAAMLKHIKKQALAGAKVVKPRARLNRRSWTAIAATLLLLSSSIWFLVGRQERLQVYATGFGEWKSIQLPDGTMVKLNANSTLKSPQDWEEGTDRKVWLDGEAFFEVTKKPQTGAKFRVITKDLQVEVLGTSFNVNSRGSQTDVFLQEGQIRLSMGDQEETLQPGDFIAYSTEKKNVVERRNETTSELHTSWKDGVLILKEKSIGEILRKIEEIYGVKTVVSDTALLSKIKTVSVPMDKLELALPILERTFEARILQQGEQLIIR